MAVIKKLNEAKRLNFPSEENKKLKELKNAYFRLLDSKKEEHRNNMAMALSNVRDSKTFWSHLNYFRSKLKIETNKIDLKAWHTYFQNTMPIRQVDNYARFLGGNVVSELEKEISLQELINAINRCKIRKAPGADGITNEFYKYLPNN